MDAALEQATRLIRFFYLKFSDNAEKLPATTEEDINAHIMGVVLV